MFVRAIALLVLVAILPVFVIISLAIVFTSGFPVFFFQERVGLGGKNFRIVKFRTMTVNKAATKGSFDLGSASRVTKVGRILRKTKLDELPQLLNVINGTMSIVGPRPEIREWVDKSPDEWKIVHTVRPGITDPASIVYRNEEELLANSDTPKSLYENEIMPRKLAIYKQYISEKSVLRDLHIMFKTIIVVLKG